MTDNNGIARHDVGCAGAWRYRIGR